MENRTKPNIRLFAEYLSIIKASKSFKWFKETERLLVQFHQFLGEFPPTLELFTKFFERYSSREIRLSTRARYYYVFSAFFKWYDGSSLPFKVKSPKPVPQKVSDEEVDKLKAAITARKTHKDSIERDILIIDTYYNTGMRLADLSNLRVRDLHLDGMSPYLMVLQGKGGKDRNINLNPFICSRLKAFTRGMAPEASVFGIASKTIQSLIRNWAIKAGVPQLHPHSFRHKFATDIINRGGSLRDVQHLLGHESLATTESYLAVTDESLAKTVGLLDNSSTQDASAPGKEFAFGLEQMNESLIDIKKSLELHKTNPDPEWIENQGITHKKMIQGLAKKLASSIKPPPLWKEEVWRDLPIDFKPGKYLLPFGSLEIIEGGEMKVCCRGLADGLGEPYLSRALYSHLKSSGARFAGLMGETGLLEEWKHQVEEFLANALRFLEIIVGKTAELGVVIHHNSETTPGLLKWFPLTIWHDAISQSNGHAWIDESWYKNHEPFPGPGLWQLGCGAYIIGIAEKEETLKEFKNWHKDLRRAFADDETAKTISLKSQNLERTAQEIKQVLLEFSDTEKLGGNCELE